MRAAPPPPEIVGTVAGGMAASTGLCWAGHPIGPALGVAVGALIVWLLSTFLAPRTYRTRASQSERSLAQLREELGERRRENRGASRQTIARLHRLSLSVRSVTVDD